jgi:hypothetical protein
VLSSFTTSTGDGAVSGRPVNGEVGTGVGLGVGVAEALADAGAEVAGVLGATVVDALQAATSPTRPTRASAGSTRLEITHSH